MYSFSPMNAIMVAPLLVFIVFNEYIHCIIDGYAHFLALFIHQRFPFE